MANTRNRSMDVLEQDVQQVKTELDNMKTGVEELETIVRSIMVTKDDLQQFSQQLQQQVSQQFQQLVNTTNLGGGLNQASSSHITQSNMGNQMQNVLPRSVKLDFPSFTGGDPSGWIYRANQYFKLHPLAANEKVTLASLSLQNEACQWYQCYEKTMGTPNWEGFCQALSIRFGPSAYTDFTGALTKLRQTRSVEEYQTQFENYANRTSNLTEEFFVSCFISGLKDELQAEVKMHNPNSLNDAISKARLAEDKLNAQHRANRSFMQTARPFTQTTRSTLPPRPTTKTVPIKRLSWEEMQKRREQGLCYNCDEKFVRGHKCTEQRIYLLSGASIEDLETENEEERVEEEGQEEADQDDPPVQISLHALAGLSSPQTMKIKGHWKGQTIIILIDSGSTHNFMDPRVAKAGSSYIYPCNSFEVLIANGGKMPCKGKCRNVKVNMGEYSLKSDMYVLNLGGCDMVLGAQWLRTLGPILWHFGELWMKFTIDGHEYTLEGLQAGPSQVVSSHRMEKILKKRKQGMIAQLFSLQAIDSKEPDMPEDLQMVLATHKEVFTEPKELPPHRTHDHAIQLVPGSVPPNIRPYRYPYIQKTEIEKLVQEMLQTGIIRESTSPYSSPVILVRKKDGSWRMCVDYRALNDLTIKDKFLMPIIDELLDELHGACFFSKIDLRSGYHQIRLCEQDIPKTTFRTHEGHYEFVVMPFGLTNAPSTFQSLMNHILRPFLRKFVLVFFDDILIYSKSWDEHILHLDLILKVLNDNRLYAKRSKCDFGRTEVEYLGHIISMNGVKVDPRKIEDMKNWPKPKTLKKLRGFLGLTGYYRKFVCNYGRIAAPLTALLKKNSFHWTPVADKAFEHLKQAMCTTPVLAMPDFTKPFIIETDACDTGIGAVLMQEGRPLAFLSKALSGRNLGRSTYEKEMIAIIHAVNQWRPYLIGRHFIIKTDHLSLKYLMEQRVAHPEQQKWVSKLLGYDYEITYKKGKENVVADALSRKFEDSAELQAISFPIPNWLSKVQDEWQHDSLIQELIHLLQENPAAKPGYTWDGQYLRYKGRIALLPNSGLKKQILTELHASPMAGHSGYLKTYERLVRNFYWKGMKKDVQKFVAECDTCQRQKGETVASPGLLQPLPIPTQTWHHISMDFIEGLPKSGGKSVIMVVVDRLSKYAHFCALAHPYKAVSVAQLFIDQIFRLHGMPATIVSDRDPTFTSKFWQEFFRLQGTCLHMSSAYHPQTDGQTEIVNKCLETYLRCFVTNQPSQWSRWLPLAEWWYNTTYHTATKMTPYEALYGQPPPTLQSYIPGGTQVQAVDSTLRTREGIRQLLKENLIMAQNRMKQQADQHRTEREFKVGDMVFLRLQPYRQTSLKLKGNQKLAPKFYGPYPIVQRIGNTAYKLELPSSSKIHPVFHVSCLKAVVGAQVHIQTELPEFEEDGSLVVIPEVILDRRTRQLRHRTITEVLVQWQGLQPEDATWEPLHQFQQQFPQFQL